MPVQITMTKGRVPVKIYTNDVDSKALTQLYNISQLPFIHHHIAAMPDVHVGKGATVGSVIPTVKALIPAAVGVDIGCGMNAVRLSLKAHQLPYNLRGLRTAIEAAVPVGLDQHKKDVAKNSTIRAIAAGLEPIIEKHPKLYIKKHRPYLTWVRQLGTLGSGNHFIELCLDENNDVWIMLHSGSRGIGNQIGQYFIEKAKIAMGDQLGRLPDKELAYLSEGTDLFNDYLEAVEWAQDYAMENRKEMMRLVLEVLKKKLPAFKVTKEAINCHHNYISREFHFGETVYVTRKGAIQAEIDQLGIIPGSMGAKSFIVKGKGNLDSFFSCSHGAGRVMSRSKAKAHFNESDLIDQTQGVECRKDRGVLDEIPSAYKDIDTVMANQNDLIEVVHTLKQVMCIKG
ncbi:MAG TPA: RNA-splicing ligase RtcB [Gammaproteobacteria bacterium]|nr:RNA-splicing ligase RtcB [Gammaproteobacteria bacterium]MEC8012359.1 RtcB family protein [Pseudomonadota bacterium]HBF06642.1 RNA-splicing ligase RtcB [Gammaproteobacteria bacterium]HCK92234.1 RNA-splicing ligase RtcB [Gammaproteobacteria bacterium]|tara:strand:+ start:25825 stop:27021 length:1197 start_codon:yes stop_codon:yes gene_type:complete